MIPFIPFKSMRKFLVDIKRRRRDQRVNRGIWRRQARRILFEIGANPSTTDSQSSSSSSNGGWGTPIRVDETDDVSISSIASSYSDEVFDLKRWIPYVQQHWDKWMSEVDTRCAKALQFMSAFPNPRNMDALMGLETIKVQMKQVCNLYILIKKIKRFLLSLMEI